jgi:hypothetical protein
MISRLLIIIIALTLELTILACAGKPKTDTKSQNSASPATEATKPAEPAFKVTKVEVTRRRLKFGGPFGGVVLVFSDGEKMGPSLKAPKKGQTFVIVSFSLDVPASTLRFDPHKDLILNVSIGFVDACGCDDWTETQSGQYEAGPHEGRRLYSISSDRLRSAKIHFLGSDYPIEPFLSPSPK